MIEAKQIASLEPGKLYVIKALFKSDEELEKYQAYLHRWAPECRFLILDSRSELMSTIPEVDVPEAR